MERARSIDRFYLYSLLQVSNTPIIHLPCHSPAPSCMLNANKCNHAPALIVSACACWSQIILLFSFHWAAIGVFKHVHSDQGFNSSWLPGTEQSDSSTWWYADAVLPFPRGPAFLTLQYFFFLEIDSTHKSCFRKKDWESHISSLMHDTKPYIVVLVNRRRDRGTEID